MSISKQHKKEAQEFVKTMEDMCELIDSWSKLIPEGEYLKGMNTLKTIFNMKEDMFKPEITVVNLTHPYFQRQYARSEMPERSEILKSDVEKLDCPKNSWVICPDCDRIVKRKGLKIHRNSQICFRNKKTKRLSNNASQDDTSKLEECLTRLHHTIGSKLSPYRLKVWYGSDDEITTTDIAGNELIISNQ